MKTLTLNEPFPLELGGCLDGLTIAYDTFGTLNDKGDNVVWVCHALTASSDVADWWPGTLEKDRFLDPAKYFVVCANVLGSCYGTTGPLSINPATGEPYYGTFPEVTVRDQVACHRLLARHLGVSGIYALIGSSLGAYQALEWAVADPSLIQRLVVIAANAYSTPWVLAIHETMLMALEADATFGEPSPEAGASGMATARAQGLLVYRGPEAYDITQDDHDHNPDQWPHRACTYQRYQGLKLVKRFNAYSYQAIVRSVLTHNIARGRDCSVADIIATVHIPALVVAISSDLLFPVPVMQELATQLPQSRYAVIDSAFGHDGFLVEADQLNALILDFYHATNDDKS